MFQTVSLYVLTLRDNDSAGLTIKLKKFYKGESGGEIVFYCYCTAFLL